MQAKVPQNVDMEDRVVGSFTLRQFLILFSGGVFDIAGYYMFGNSPLKFLYYFLALTVTGVAAMFAFYRPTEQPLEILALAGVRMFQRPRLMVWKKYVEVPQVVVKAPESNAKKEERKKKGLAEIRSDFEKLARTIDTGMINSDNPLNRPNNIRATPTDQEKDFFSVEGTVNQAYDPQIMAMVKNRKKKDPLVSEVASISPNQSFDYPSISMVPDNFLQDIK